ncbi:hypothetical protein LCGC14_0903400 [marine sediment metagenome]|uniref:Uncharacterized protein n=1 Tax=marine sediment metagenome TaxID=412755 RepID=A0A0F9RES5_9ZZZZ
MPGKFYPQIEELQGAGTLEELKSFLYEALKAMANDISQVPTVSTEGNPENELKAEKAGMLVFDRTTGKTYTKELADIGGDQRRGWKEVQLL